MKTMTKSAVVIAFSSIISLSFQSCYFSQNSSVDNLTAVKNPDNLISGYSSLYKDLSKHLVSECLEMPVSNAEMDEFAENYIESYWENLTPQEVNFFNEIHYRPYTRADKKELISELVESLQNCMFNDDLALLESQIDSFYQSIDFQQLSLYEQQELETRLECLINIRNSLTDIIIDCFEKEKITTKSPGDRMVWSEAAKQMTDEQRSKAIDAGIAGIAIGIAPVASPAVSVAVTIIALVKSLFG